MGSCTTPANSAPAANLNNNWDHDVITQIYPTGSGGGIGAVNSGQYDIARSSRIGTAGELAVSHFYAFAKDGLAVLKPLLKHVVDQINGGDHPRAD